MNDCWDVQSANKTERKGQSSACYWQLYQSVYYDLWYKVHFHICTLCSNTFQQVNSPSWQSSVSPVSCTEEELVLFSTIRPTSLSKKEMTEADIHEVIKSNGMQKLTDKCCTCGDSAKWCSLQLIAKTTKRID